jgi:hypothetical protein
MYKKFFTIKASVEPSSFLCYDAGSIKMDVKVHAPILEKGDSAYYKSLSVARLRARTGGDLDFITSLVS